VSRCLLLRDPVGTPNTPQIANTGSAWPSFAVAYGAAHEGNRACIFNTCAVGGTKLFNVSQWDPVGAATNLIKTVIDARAANRLRLWDELRFTIGYDIVLWHQGESDRDAMSGAYANKLQRLAQYLINNGFDAFCFYEIAERTKDPEPTPLLSNHNNVRKAQRDAAVWFREKNIPGFLIGNLSHFNDRGFVSLVGNDGLHYLQTGYNDMGKQGGTNTANIVKQLDLEKLL